MKKIRLILLSLIILTSFIILETTKNYKKEDNVILEKEEYLALSGTEALKSITIKKEITSPKEYYKAGDDIKYTLTIANNNSESVKINILDNYSNLEKTQRNLVIESVKCNNTNVTVSGNKIEIKDVTLAANGTYKCNVDGYAKSSYPEGKVNSRAKVYIDDEGVYNEDEFTYLVRDSILDIQVNEFLNYSYFYESAPVYQLKIKNISETEASGKVVLVLNPDTKDIRINEPYENNYTYSVSGAKSNLVDSSKIKFKCLASDGGGCTSTLQQYLNFTIPGLNPGETMTLNVTLSHSKDFSHFVSVYDSVAEYDKTGNNIIKISSSKNYLRFNSSGDMYIEIYPVDDAGNKVSDLSQVEFKGGKAKLFLNYNFYRHKDYDYSPRFYVSDATINLPANVEYDTTREYTSSGCGASNTIFGAKITFDNNNGIHTIKTACGMGSNKFNLIYNANVKVPITINYRLINKQICLDSLGDSNKYCFGPVVKFKDATASEKDNVVDVKLQFINDNYLGDARDAVISYIYDAGLEIDENTLENATIDKKNRTITWTIPLMRKDYTYTVGFKAQNNGWLTSMNINGTAEGNSYSKKISISGAQAKPQEPQKPDNPEDAKGDWNGNGLLDLPDLVRCRKYLAGVDGISIPENAIVDMNDDEEIDITDLAKLRKYFATDY